MRELTHLFSQMYASMSGLRAEDLRDAHEVNWRPPVDVIECAAAIVVVVELPGVAEDQIHVVADQGVLRLSGCRPKQLPKDTCHVHQMEIPYGTFGRSLRLPESVDVAHITAQYRDGYLTITLPKALPAQEESCKHE